VLLTLLQLRGNAAFTEELTVTTSTTPNVGVHVAELTR
jgi:hypothetical protein